MSSKGSGFAPHSSSSSFESRKETKAGTHHPNSARGGGFMKHSEGNVLEQQSGRPHERPSKDEATKGDKKKSLFDDGEAQEDTTSAGAFKINKSFAKQYSQKKDKEELERLKKTYGDEEDDSDLSDEDDKAEGLTKNSQFDFFRTLSLLKAHPSDLKSKLDKLATERDTMGDNPAEGEEVASKKKKEKPMYLKDHERKRLLTKGALAFVDDEDDDKPSGLTYEEEKEQAKKQFKLAAGLDDEEGEGFGGLDDDFLQLRTKTAEDMEKEENEYATWLESQEKVFEGKKAEELEPLKRYWNDPSLSESDRFLRDYVVKQLWKDKDEGIPSYDEVVADSEDEEDVEKQEEYEKQYNFRFEEDGGDQIMTFPRDVVSVRRKDSARSEKRNAAKLRKEEAKKRKEEEIKRLKSLKQKDILDRLKLIQEITGCRALSLDDLDLDSAFDPASFDKKLNTIFNEEYYQEEEAVKPSFDDLDVPDSTFDGLGENLEPVIDEEDQDEEEEEEEEEEEQDEEEDEADENDHEGQVLNEDAEGETLSTKKDKKKKKKKNEEEDVQNGDGEDLYYDEGQGYDEEGGYYQGNDDENGYYDENEEDPNFIMDADYLPDAQQSSKAKKGPVDPSDVEALKKHVEDYYSLDYEDIVGETPVRFKYRTVPANDFGLSIDEILNADDRELNQWVSLKKITQYRSADEERQDLQRYKKKGKNKKTKSQILQSVYSQDGKDGAKPHSYSSSTSSQLGQKRKVNSDQGFKDSSQKKKKKSKEEKQQEKPKAENKDASSSSQTDPADGEEGQDETENAGEETKNAQPESNKNEKKDEKRNKKKSKKNKKPYEHGKFHDDKYKKDYKDGKHASSKLSGAKNSNINPSRLSVYQSLI